MTDEKTTPSDEPVDHSTVTDDASTDARPVSTVDAPEVEPEPASSEPVAAHDESVLGTEPVQHDEPGAAPVQYGVGPLSIREVALTGVWAVAFVVSFFPALVSIFPRFAVVESVWSSGLEWVLAIGLPTVAVFLVLLRRFSPQGIRRVGSLAIDQFASVAFSVSAVVWFTVLWSSLVDLTQRGIFTATWVVWVEVFLMVLGVVLTVFAPFLPVLGEDFRHRDDAAAHRNARPIRPVSPRPAPVAPVPASAPQHQGGEPVGYVHDPAASAQHAPVSHESPSTWSTTPAAADEHPTDAYAPQQWSAPEAGPVDAAEPFAYVADSAAEPAEHAEPVTEPFVPVQQAFWALVPEERDVLDEQGVPLFRIGPTAWALVIADRGEAFVVRHEDGRVGYLHDVTGVTRG